MCLEAILGVSRADVDTDFELTNFAFGWQSLSGGIYRSRVYDAYKSLMAAVNSFPLANGLTDSFRNRWVSFVLSCGISIDKINAFRAACIDGTPDVITVIVQTYSVSKSGSHVTYDNDTATVSENDSYSVGVTPASGYVISDVTVTMGGVDITNAVFSGTPTVRRVHVTNNLSHCSTSNRAGVVEEGAAYVATITANEGYTLDGATVTITMGGINVSQYYSNGVISIQSVTGDVVVSVSAVESARVNLFNESEATLNARIRNVGGIGTGSIGRVVTGTIGLSNISVLTIEGVTEVISNDNSYARIGLYSSSAGGESDFVAVFNGGNKPTYSFDVASLKTQYPSATHARIEICLTYPNNMVASDVADLAIYGE